MAMYKSYYSMNRWWFHIRNIVFFPLFVLAKILPKKDFFVFGSMSGYAVADNSKYYFINTYKPNYYWITKNKGLLKTAVFENHFPIYAYSLKGIFIQLFAKKAFYTHKLDDFVPPLIMGAEITALWHGVPFKKIGAAEHGETDASALRKCIRKIRARVMPYSYYMYCNNVVCPDPEYEDVFRRCFANSAPKILIEQYPRVQYARKIAKQRKILYCPTYRKNRKLADVISSVGILGAQFSKWLQSNDVVFIIRPHPIDAEKLDVISLPERIEIDTSLDLYETINQYPVVLTDYSSIMYDAEALGINVFLLADDVQEYAADESGLFEGFLSYIWNNHFECIDMLLPRLESVFQNFGTTASFPFRESEEQKG